MDFQCLVGEGEDQGTQLLIELVVIRRSDSAVQIVLVGPQKVVVAIIGVRACLVVASGNGLGTRLPVLPVDGVDDLQELLKHFLFLLGSDVAHFFVLVSRLLLGLLVTFLLGDVIVTLVLFEGLGSLILGVHYLADVLQFPDNEADEGKGEEDGLKELFLVLLIIPVAEVRQNLGVVLSLVVHGVVILVILNNMNALDSA